MGEPRTQAISVCVRVRPRIALEQEGRTAEQVKEVHSPEVPVGCLGP